MPAEWIILVALFIFGYVLFFVEVVFIPGIGFAGILGVIAFIAASVLAWKHYGPMVGGVTACISFGTTLLATFLFYKSKASKRLLLDNKLSRESGVVASQQAAIVHVGELATVVSPLRPIGIVSIGGTRYDALTAGEYIDKGQTVKVIEIQGNNIIVTVEE